MARAMWKGVLALGSTRIPVKLYAAVEDRAVHFRLLHAKDLVPVEQRMVHPGTGRVVPSEDIRKGFALDAGRFVLLDEADLAAAEPEDSRDIEPLRFVPDSAIDARWYDRPYYLGPDGSRAAYAALMGALRAESRTGIFRWTMRKRTYVGALREHAGHLMLVTLRHAGEVVATETLPAPEGRDLTKAEMEMAAGLVDALTQPFDPEAYRDEYRDRVMDLIAAKAKGRKPPKAARPRAPAKGSLEELLRRSMKEAKVA